MENLIAHALLAVFALVGPRVRLKTKGGNASHSLLGVGIRRADHPMMTGQSWAGVLKQECAEWRILWLGSVLVTVPIGFVASGPAIVVNMGALAAAFLANLLLRAVTDGMDAYGTNLEIFEGEKTDEYYREKELNRKSDPVAFDRRLERWEAFARVFAFLGYRPFFVEREVR